MRQAFTMLELILVIVSISILATVSITKLSITRDNARATACVHEVTHLIESLATYYTTLGPKKVSNTLIVDMTNITVLSLVSGGNTGIRENRTLLNNVDYQCEGELLVTMTYKSAQLLIEIFNSSNPAGQEAFGILKTSLDINETNQKLYRY